MTRMPPADPPETRPPHASFAGVHFRLEGFDPSHQEQANAAYAAARAALCEAMPLPARKRALTNRFGFPEALSALERDPLPPGSGPYPHDLDLSHERLLRGVLARLDKTEAIGPADLVRLQVHWAARGRRSVLAVPLSSQPSDLRFDPNALELSPISRAYGGPRSPRSPRREIRIIPLPAPGPAPDGLGSGGGGGPSGGVGLDPASLLDPLGWRVVIGLACLVRLVTEAEIAAELGVMRLRRCASPRCGAWFLEQRPGGGRPRTHCGPACRVTALRARALGAAPGAPKPPRKKIAKE